MAAQLGMNFDEAQKQQILQINELDEIRQDALQRTMLIQNQQKTCHDKFIKKNSLILEIGHYYSIHGLKILKGN